jgi:hypothetical protein
VALWSGVISGDRAFLSAVTSAASWASLSATGMRAEPCGTHGQLRAESGCRLTRHLMIPCATAAPTVSIATSTGEGVRDGTKLWWNSSLAAIRNPAGQPHAVKAVTPFKMLLIMIRA